MNCCMVFMVFKEKGEKEETISQREKDEKEKKKTIPYICVYMCDVLTIEFRAHGNFITYVVKPNVKQEKEMENAMKVMSTECKKWGNNKTVHKNWSKNKKE